MRKMRFLRSNYRSSGTTSHSIIAFGVNVAKVREVLPIEVVTPIPILTRQLTDLSPSASWLSR